MNEQDFRDVCALMKATTGASPEECFRFADAMVEARRVNEEPQGIVAIKKKRTAK